MSTFDTLLSLAEKFSGSEAITLHPERCLNTRFRPVDCSLCADICPAEDAIAVTNGKPSLNNEACLQCGLCLHRCPTEAFTRPDDLSATLVKTVAALPDGSMDLACPQHPQAELGPTSQAVQTHRCLAALSPVTLLELSSLKKDLWLDDTHCAGCPLGQVYPAIMQAVTEANSWASLLETSAPILLRTGDTAEIHPAIKRPVYSAAAPPVSRRELFGSFKQTGQEVSAAKEKVEMVKAGKSVPVSERLPQRIPHQRAKILSIVEKYSPVQSPSSNPPILNLHLDSARCTACTLCARFCPTGALKFLSDGASFGLTFQPWLCLGPDCGICIPACPEQAVIARPVTESANLFAKKSLAAGHLTPCQRCRQPIAQGPDLPDTCFACRSRTTAADLFASFS